MNKNILNKADLENVTGGYFEGFPDGEFPEGFSCCPVCGNTHLKFVAEVVVEDTGHPTIDKLVTDNTYRLYDCDRCGKQVWLYANFYEKNK